MRTAFLETLFELAERDPRIWLVTGDLGYSVLEPFAAARPDRFLNAGVAEQNMIGLAAGIALSGNIVFVYSIANFPTLRCLEQIRNDVCHHRANVKIVSVGGGFAYGPHGHTHHGLEDLAAMRAMPGMAALAPGDPREARAATRAVAARPGPCYLRLGKANEPTVHPTEPSLEVGRPILVRPGADACLFASGSMLAPADEAADELAARGVACAVWSVPWIKPMDPAAILDAVGSARLVVAAEEHGIVGGLGSALAEILAEAGRGVPLLRHGAPDAVSAEIGSQAHLRARLGRLADVVERGLERAGVRRPARKLISVVTPCYNERDNVEECRAAVRRLFENELARYDHEHIFCDNASTDGTVEILRRLAAGDRRVRVILNSRNFGPFRSLFNGLRAARGDAALAFLPADLQDPPELLPEFVRRWERGFEVVRGARRRREEGLAWRAVRRAYYRFASAISNIEMPVDVGEFQFVDRKVLDTLKRHDDHHPYVRGMIAHAGFRATTIEYTWRGRARGISKNRLPHLIDQALNGLISFTNAPMRLCMLAGFAIAAVSLLYAAFTFAANLIYLRRLAPPGVPTLIVALFFFSGVQLFFFGVLGEYVAAIHSQVRRRPRVIERERINFDFDFNDDPEPDSRPRRAGGRVSPRENPARDDRSPTPAPTPPSTPADSGEGLQPPQNLDRPLGG